MRVQLYYKIAIRNFTQDVENSKNV